MSKILYDQVTYILKKQAVIDSLKNNFKISITTKKRHEF